MGFSFAYSTNKVADKESLEVVQRAKELGVTFLDTSAFSKPLNSLQAEPLHVDGMGAMHEAAFVSWQLPSSHGNNARIAERSRVDSMPGGSAT